MIFKDEKEQNDIKEILRQGVSSRFWLIIVEAIKDSKKALEQELLSADFNEIKAEQYKFEMETIKNKIRYLDTLMKTPENIISWVTKPESKMEDFDPYAKV